MPTFSHSFLEDQPPSRVVIIGGTGVIGRTLLNVLVKKTIPVLSLSTQQINLLDFHAATRLAKLLEPTDSVVVLAGIAPNRGRGLKAVVDNIGIGMSIVEAFVRQPVSHVVYLSSDAVYPRNIERINEETPVEPSDPYAAMHLSRERIFSSDSAIPVSILRCTQVSSLEDTHYAYGPNRFRWMGKKEGKIVLFGKGEDKRDHISVNDVASIISQCLFKRSQGILNIATGVSLSFAEVAEIVAPLINPLPQITYVPREIPLTHRFFDPKLLKAAFPNMRFTPLHVHEADIHHNPQLMAINR